MRCTSQIFSVRARKLTNRLRIESDTDLAQWSAAELEAINVSRGYPDLSQEDMDAIRAFLSLESLALKGE